MTKKITQLSRLAAAISVTTLFGCGGGAATSTDVNVVDPAVPVTDWEMVWSDEFDGTSINDNNWTHEVNCAGGGNNESQCYTDSDENSFVSDGTLKIVAMPAEEGAEKPYTSARLVTQYKADFKYGRMEMRAKLPSGQGSWPAFWMMPTDSVYGEWPRSGEIDILEAVNLGVLDADGNPETRVYGTLHYGSTWPNNKHTGKDYTTGANPADDFHTYAVEWQEGEIRWYMDDYLYATQRRSEVRYNSKGEATGLAHRGWYTEYYEQGTGELVTHYDNAPFDQEFFLILNFAVGGDWAGNVNDTGIDAEAFAYGQTYEVDYVRVYQCSANPDTGKGCETIRPGYADPEDALVEGAAPIPSPPSTGVAQNLTIFGGTTNPNWPAWDCCGGSTPAIVEDADKGPVYEFAIGANPTVMGFVSRDAFITDENGTATPFDGSPMVENGSIKFDLKVTSLPNDATAAWLFKVESNEATTAVEMPLMNGYVGPNAEAGATPEAGVWESYEFPLSMLADAGLDVSGIDVIMVFPAWGAGEGATYRMANVEISQASNYPELVVFDDATNPNWPMWDCCGGSTPTEEMDDAEHGLTAEFRIGSTPTVMGFITRPTDGGGDTPFDASALADGGLLQFDMRVVSMPNDASAAWLFKVESNGAETAVELPLTSSVEGAAPAAGEWQTYTFPLSTLQGAGLDLSAIDVIMVFPAWGAGEGAAYRIDNLKIYHPDAGAAAGGLTLFADEAADQWTIWDCCGGSTPTVEADDDTHGSVAEFRIGGTPTVMGFLADDDVYYDASALLSTGVVRFEMKLTSAPNDASAAWLFKIESGDATTAVELPLSSSVEGVDPVVGEWQTYTYTLQSLYDAGLDISAIDVVMVFPAWGAGDGAVYRIDNAEIAAQ